MSDRSMRTRRFLRRAAHVIRGLLLFVTLLAVGTWWLWTARVDLIDGLDEKMVARYVQAYSSRLDEATRLFEASKTAEAEKLLEDLLTSMDGAGKRDRLAPTYSDTLALLRQVSIKRGDFSRASEISGASVEFDPRNYRYLLAHAYDLNRIGKTREAIEALGEAYRIFPSSLDTAEPLAIMLYRQGMRKEAREVLSGFLEANRGGSLRLFYTSGDEGFTSARSTLLTSLALSPKPLSYEFPVNSPGMTRLALGFINATGVNIRISSIAMTTSEGKKGLDLDSSISGVKDMERVKGGAFEVSGESPIIFLDIAGVIGGSELLGLEAEIEFERRLPERLKQMMRGA